MQRNLMFISFFSGLIVLVLAACSQTPEVSDDQHFIQGNLVEAQGQDDARAIIEEVELANGNLVRFIDESVSFEGGGIGMLEIIVDESKPLLASLDASATPLEVFQALAPERSAPSQLLDHHQRMATASDDVPELARKLDLSPMSLEDGGVIWSVCTNDFAFKNWYNSKLHVPNNFKHFGFGADMTGTKYGVTGKSTRRALSVCNHPNNFSGKTKVRVEKQFGQNLWILIQGTTYNMIPHRGMWYASQDPSFYLPTKYRVKASGGYFSIAGSWGKK